MGFHLQSKQGRKLWVLSVLVLLLACSITLAAAVDEKETAGTSKAAPTAAGRTHKPLFPLDTRDYVTFFFGFFCLVLAAAGEDPIIWTTYSMTTPLFFFFKMQKYYAHNCPSGGIGGGGVLVPLYILVLGFDPKSAIALSNVTILGAAISNVTLAAMRRHPNVDRPLISWDLILIMEPMVISGAVLGAIANKLLPSLIVTICLVVMLSYLGNKTMKKGLNLWKKEGGWQGVFGGGQGLPSSTAGGAVSASEGEKRGLLAGQNGKYDGSTASPLHEDAVRRVCMSVDGGY